MEVGIKKALFLAAFALLSTLFLFPAQAGAAVPCAATQPRITWKTGNVRWVSFQDYLSRQLTVDVHFASSSANSSHVSILASLNSEGTSLASPLPYGLGDINDGGTTIAVLRYDVPTGVSTFRSNLYVTAEDACGNSFFYPRPEDNVARYSMTTSDNGRGQVTVNVNWDAAHDTNNNAVATVKYRLYPAIWWDGGQPAYSTAGTVEHTGATDALAIDNLRPGRFYDFTVEVADPDGVDGVQPQADSPKLLRDDRFTITNLLSNPHPGPFDEVRARDFYSNSLYWYSSQNAWESGLGYEYLLQNGVNHEYSIVQGKTAWQSVTDRSHNRLFIAGELPRFDGSHRYRAMIGVIDQNTNNLKVYSLPYTDDCNELIGIALDMAGNRLLTGERWPGSPLMDSWWPNGGGLWSIPIDSLGDPTKYARVYQDPYNRTWDKMVVFNGRLYATLYAGSGTLVSAALSDIPAGSPMSPAAWRTEFTSGVFSMIVSPTHGLVVARNGHDGYLSLRINNGSGWRSVDSNKVYPGEGLYELADHRFLVTRDAGSGTHFVQVASVTGEWEYLGIAAGGWPSYNHTTDPGSSIYYGTVAPGKVMRMSYAP